MIGNPYNFAISWADILAAIGNPDGLNLVYFDRGYKEATKLDAFQGGVVIRTNFSAQTDTLFIPVTLNRSINRLRAPQKPAPLNDQQWYVPIHLQSGNLVHEVSGIGIDPKAEPGIDKKDMPGLPLLETVLDLNFPEEDHPMERISKNFVSPRNSHSWDMHLSSTTNQPIQMRWDNRFFGDNPYHLWIEDTQTGRIIDMRQQNGMWIDPSEEHHHFRLHFGPAHTFKRPCSIKGHGLTSPFPSPSISS